MKNIILIATLFLSTDLLAQTKKDTLGVTNFTVDKSGKTLLSYTYYDDTEYKIEGKDNSNKWVLLFDGGSPNAVSPALFNQTDTFTLKKLGTIKEVRIKFIQPRPYKTFTKTIKVL